MRSPFGFGEAIMVLPNFAKQTLNAAQKTLLSHSIQLDAENDKPNIGKKRAMAILRQETNKIFASGTSTGSLSLLAPINVGLASSAFSHLNEANLDNSPPFSTFKLSPAHYIEILNQEMQPNIHNSNTLRILKEELLNVQSSAKVSKDFFNDSLSFPLTSLMLHQDSNLRCFYPHIDHIINLHHTGMGNNETKTEQSPYKLINYTDILAGSHNSSHPPIYNTALPIVPHFDRSNRDHLGQESNNSKTISVSISPTILYLLLKNSFANVVNVFETSLAIPTQYEATSTPSSMVFNRMFNNVPSTEGYSMPVSLAGNIDGDNVSIQRILQLLFPILPVHTFSPENFGPMFHKYSRVNSNMGNIIKELSKYHQNGMVKQLAQFQMIFVKNIFQNWKNNAQNSQISGKQTLQWSLFNPKVFDEFYHRKDIHFSMDVVSIVDQLLLEHEKNKLDKNPQLKQIKAENTFQIQNEPQHIPNSIKVSDFNPQSTSIGDQYTTYDGYDHNDSYNDPGQLSTPSKINPKMASNSVKTPLRPAPQNSTHSKPLNHHHVKNDIISDILGVMQDDLLALQAMDQRLNLIQMLESNNDREMKRRRREQIRMTKDYHEKQRIEREKLIETAKLDPFETIHEDKITTKNGQIYQNEEEFLLATKGPKVLDELGLDSGYTSGLIPAHRVPCGTRKIGKETPSKKSGHQFDFSDEDDNMEGSSPLTTQIGPQKKLPSAHSSNTPLLTGPVNPISAKSKTLFDDFDANDFKDTHKRGDNAIFPQKSSETEKISFSTPSQTPKKSTFLTALQQRTSKTPILTPTTKYVSTNALGSSLNPFDMRTTPTTTQHVTPTRQNGTQPSTKPPIPCNESSSCNFTTEYSLPDQFALEEMASDTSNTKSSIKPAHHQFDFDDSIEIPHDTPNPFRQRPHTGQTPQHGATTPSRGNQLNPSNAFSLLSQAAKKNASLASKKVDKEVTKATQRGSILQELAVGRQVEEVTESQLRFFKKQREKGNMFFGGSKFEGKKK
jgi:hypothetical protein